MRGEQEATHAVSVYGDTVRRICFLHLKNYADTEDIFQTVFLKYLQYRGEFVNAEHEKAWFIRVALNACKDYLKWRSRHVTVAWDMVEDMAAPNNDQSHAVVEQLLTLPDKYKQALYLYYFEGYSAAEIAQIMKRAENTVYSLLSRGRDLLKEKLGGGDFA